LAATAEEGGVLSILQRPGIFERVAYLVKMCIE
jgi:hypothetical protein